MVLASVVSYNKELHERLMSVTNLMCYICLYASTN